MYTALVSYVNDRLGYATQVLCIACQRVTIVRDHNVVSHHDAVSSCHSVTAASTGRRTDCSVSLSLLIGYCLTSAAAIPVMLLCVLTSVYGRILLLFRL